MGSPVDTHLGRLLWPAAILSFFLKLLLAAFTAGSNDALTWERDLVTLRTAGFAELYRSGVQYDSPAGRPSQRQVFIHPPAVLHGLRILGTLQDLTGWPLRFWLRAGCAMADLGTLLLLRDVFRERTAALVLLAVSPAAILISGFHGNTDPLMIFFLVAAVYSAERGTPVGSALAFGLACSVKLLPLIFAPAIVLRLPGLAARLKLSAVSLGVWAALALPYIALEPSLIAGKLLGYSGATGLWGLSLVSTLAGADPYYLPAAKWIALIAAAGLPLLANRRLFERAGIGAFCFVMLSPGFGLQYLAWTFPWTVFFRRGWMILYVFVAGGFALAVYAAASQSTADGLYADLLDPSRFPVLILMGIVCWITIAAITLRWLRFPRDKERLWEG